MQITVRTVINEEASVMGDFQMSIERREKRVVEGGEDFGLGLDMGEFFRREGVSVDHLEGEVCVIVVAEAAEEDSAEVSGPD